MQVETGNNAVFAVMWDSAEVSAEPEVNEEADADTERFQQELFEAIYSVSECRTGK